ncbi:MFS transporter, partial [Salmonella sp. s51228]|uniref:MFS transporter n=1 Tax=Salmonella sp. s51228 TaxID=3159652 RepID=UPI00397F1D0A
MSGVGVGASLPVVFSYYAEFLTKKTRGRLISWLSVFWMFGQISTSLFALAIIPRTFEYKLGSINFTSWRAFVLICALPAFTSMLIFLFMPNSPR